MLKLFREVVGGIVVDKERAAAEVRADYSTTTEIADALLQRAAVPFRIGHHFASRLTDHGRSHGLKLDEIPFDKVASIYAEEAQQTFPLSEAAYREVISAEYMVYGRRGRGGPQLDEVNRMLGEAHGALQADSGWLAERKMFLDGSAAKLDAAFVALAAGQNA
jgi:argininosuccinate lyase